MVKWKPKECNIPILFLMANLIINYNINAYMLKSQIRYMCIGFDITFITLNISEMDTSAH